MISCKQQAMSGQPDAAGRNRVSAKPRKPLKNQLILCGNPAKSRGNPFRNVVFVFKKGFPQAETGVGLKSFRETSLRQRFCLHKQFPGSHELFSSVPCKRSVEEMLRLNQHNLFYNPILHPNRHGRMGLCPSQEKQTG